MKIFNFAKLAVFCFIIVVSSCKKEKYSLENEISKLPPATQTGARTFGCIVNGKAFKPTVGIFENHNLSGNYDSNIQYLYIYGTDKSNKDFSQTIALYSLGVPIQENQTYLLTDYNINGKGSGEYSQYNYYTGPVFVYYRTNSKVTGSLTITKKSNGILSGTFAYDAVNSDGTIVHVTDGRFDF